jgi:hypothetical protein
MKDGAIACPHCQKKTPLSPTTIAFLEKAETLFPGSEAMLRNAKRIEKLLREHDEYLRLTGAHYFQQIAEAEQQEEEEGGNESDDAA